jgi:hypothetical protein
MGGSYCVTQVVEKQAVVTPSIIQTFVMSPYLFNLILSDMKTESFSTSSLIPAARTCWVAWFFQMFYLLAAFTLPYLLTSVI